MKNKKRNEKALLILAFMLAVFFVLLVGCTSHNDDIELLCEIECNKCESVKLTCKGDKTTEKIKVETPKV